MMDKTGLGRDRLVTTAQWYFMLVAKEQSIIRAAEQLYISPQNLSNHIRRLEKEYGVLFTRYPHFKLTPAGQALLCTLQKINTLEKGLTSELKELREESIGTLHFGIHVIRGHVVIPRVIPKFHTEYPNIHVAVHYNNMIENEKMLLNGALDIFWGIDVHALPEFNIVPLSNEEIYFVASRELLLKNGISACAEQISLAELERFPYLLSPEDSQIRKKIKPFCDREGLMLNEVITISDYEMQLTLALQGIGACFIPEMMLRHIEQLNLLEPESKQLCALKIKNLTETTRLSIVTHRLAYKSKPLKCFVRLLKEEFSVPENSN